MSQFRRALPHISLVSCVPGCITGPCIWRLQGGMAMAAVARILLWLARTYQQLPRWGRKVFGPPIRLASGESSLSTVLPCCQWCSDVPQLSMAIPALVEDSADIQGLQFRQTVGGWDEA